MDIFKEALELHKKLEGKIETGLKMDITTAEELSLVYSPGVAQPCLEIAKNPETVYDYTIKKNTVAIISDGSAVLGLGNIGPLAAIPVMEGKAMLFKKFAQLNAFPICLDTQNVDEIVETITRIAPVFGGINLEDISAPRCFEIEDRLQDLGIPVFHDDQHGTAIVVLAGLINAAKVVGKSIFNLKIVINGAGAAGGAICRLLKCIGDAETQACTSVKEIIIVDRSGILHKSRPGLTKEKIKLLDYTNETGTHGSLRDALRGADVFIGVSVKNLLTKEDIEVMAPKPIIFALANPTPEIMPEEAFKGGAAVVATGRSDMPNQVNNVLGFPGIFKGALEAKATKITFAMKLAAAYAIADSIENPTFDHIIPSSLDMSIPLKVAEAVRNAVTE
ncbi:MAG: NAD(P)-dependent malic enzyme [Saprospiraceae bacterium]